jgi:thiosulfate dehydrogenase [quinone] large subunit
MKKSKLFIVLLRMVIGWIFLYQGIIAFTSPGWSLVPFIQPAHTFPEFYNAVLQAPILTYATYAVKIFYVVLGVLLMIGVAVRLASFFGVLLMLFFYFPLLNFPYLRDGGYIVDYHIVYALILMYFLFAHSHGHNLKSIFKSSRH